MLEERLRELYAIENARKLVRDPQLFKGVVETLKETPQGVKVMLTDPGGTMLRTPKGLTRMASNLLDPQNYRAGGEERRKFAAQIGCDPETTNPVLIALVNGHESWHVGLTQRMWSLKLGVSYVRFRTRS